MRLLSSLIIVAFAVIASFAQEFEWRQVQRPATVYGDWTIKQKFYVVDDTVYYDDNLWRTTDHGVTWNFQKNVAINWKIDGSNNDKRIVGRAFLMADSAGINTYDEKQGTWIRTIDDTAKYRSVAFSLAADGDIYVFIYYYYRSDHRAFRSPDNGMTWISLTPSQFRSQDVLGRIFGAVVGTSYYGISSDKGITWDSVYSATSRGAIYSMAHLRDGSSYAVTKNESGWWLLKSDRDGRDWRTVTSLANYTVSGKPNGNTTAFDIMATTKGTLFAYVAGNTYQTLRSTDGGQLWHAIPQPPDGVINGLPAVDNAGVLYIQGRASKERDAYHDGIYISTDEGQRWSPRGYPYFRISSMYPDRVRNNVLVNMYMPFRYSAGVGTSYSSAPGYTPHCVVLGDSMSTVKTLFQTSTNPVIDTGEYFICESNGSYYAFVNVGLPKVFRSSDGGVSWEERLHPAVGGFYAIAITRQGILYIGTYDYVFRSDDKAISWDQVINGITNPNIYSIAESPTGFIFAGSQSAIYRSKETYFVKLKPNLINTNVLCFAFDSVKGIYAGTDRQGVTYSNDNGETWKPLRTGLPEGVAVTALMTIPQGYVLAATFDGLYALQVGDSVWHDESSGLNDRALQSLALMDDETYLVGTSVSGIYVNKPFPAPPFLLSVKLPPSVRVDGASQLAPNYPNPFSLETKIQYEVIEPGWVTLEIFSLMGEKVMTLENDYHASGTYESSFSGNDIPSGTYIYRLKIAQHAEDRLMIKQ